MTNAFFIAFIKGYTTTASLIVAIGAQNAFILKQGLLKSNTLVIAVLASIIDILMISIGVYGLGVIIASHAYLMDLARYGGLLFLLGYGCKCFYSAIFKTSSLENEKIQAQTSLKWTVITLLAMSFLNPHMYLDTLLLIGTIGGQLAENQRLYFIIGAGCASVIWFFLLSYGARLLIPIFQKPLAWKALDTIIGVTMWSIAASIYYEI